MFSKAASPGANGSKATEIGTELREFGCGYCGPISAVYDPLRRTIDVADSSGHGVSFFQGNRSILGNVSFQGPTSPWSFGFDPVTSDLYVLDPNDSQVSVYNASGKETVVGPVFLSPIEAVFDPADGYVYVSNGRSDPGFVSVLNGSQVIAEVATGAYPGGELYDPVTQDIYVANGLGAAQGGGNLTVIHGTTVVGTIGRPGAFSNPWGMAYDPVHAQLWVGNSNVSHPASGSVSLVNASETNGTSVAGILPAGSGVRGVLFDPANGLVYVSDSFSHRLAAFNGTKVEGTISTGAGPMFPGYDPADGGLYVSEYGANAVGFVSTVLGIDAIGQAPSGPVLLSVPLRSVAFNTTIWGIGAGTDAPSFAGAPADGLSCNGLSTGGVLDPGVSLSTNCAPDLEGLYRVWFNVTDALDQFVSVSETIQVLGNLSVARPKASAATIASLASADVGETFDLADGIAGGSGTYGNYTWSGLPGSGLCRGLSGPAPVCTIPSPQTLTIALQVEDSNGWESKGPALTFPIFLRPSIPGIAPNRSQSDVGQAVEFEPIVLGDPGAIARWIWWISQPGGCTNLTRPTLECRFASARSATLGVTAEDIDGVVFASSARSFQVYDLPTVTSIGSNRTIADVGQSIQFSANGSGGYGPLSFLWSGLPGGCTSTTSVEVSCTLTEPATLAPSARAVDANGGVSTSFEAASIVVSGSLEIALLSAAPNPVETGRLASFAASVSGGSGEETFAWYGLPSGCNLTGAQGVCRMGAAGGYTVFVIGTDAAGQSSESPSVYLVVTTPPGSPGTNPPPGPIDRLSALIGNLLPIVLVALVVVVSLALAIRWPSSPRRSGTPPSGTRSGSGRSQAPAAPGRIDPSRVRAPTNLPPRRPPGNRR